VVYLGGMREAAQPSLGGLIRVDTIGMEDPHNLTKYDNNNKDGGLLQTATTGSVNLKPVPPFPPLQAYDQVPDGQGGFIQTLDPVQIPAPRQWVNLISDPYNPFLTNSTVLVADTTQFNNTGADVFKFTPFDGDGGGNFTGDWHQILSMKDPLTGHARLLFGTDNGVYSVVDQGNGDLFQSFGSSSLSDPSGTDPVITGSRNGNLQITQFYDGAAQPSVQAAEIAAAILGSGGLIYGNADDNGFPVSDPHILSNGNLTWQGPSPFAGVTHGSLGDGTGIATDQTGTGTAYSFQWPASGLFSFLSFTNFFVVNPTGTGYIARTGTGGTSLVQVNNGGTVPDPQWPAIAAEATNPNVPVIPDVVQSAIAVNPVEAGNQIVIGSASGRVFRSSNQGKDWFVIADPTALDGSIVTGLAYGAPDSTSTSHNLDDFIYAGTADGHLFVTLDCGGVNGKDLVNISGTGTNGLPGDPIMSISPTPRRHTLNGLPPEAYVVTLKGVFHVSFNVAYPTNGAPVVSAITWQNLTGNLFTLNSTTGLFTNPANVGLTDAGTTRIAQEQRVQYLTSLAVDWRFQIPNATGGGVHPILYIGGEGGVFRSTNTDTVKTTTWTVFPNVSDGSAVDGGYLPDSHVTKLTLSVGNVNVTTGQPDQAGGPNLLIATTFGRGDFAIRLPNNSPFNPVAGPRVFSVTPDPLVSGKLQSVTVTFTGTVDPSSFKTSAATLVGPSGSIAITGVMDITMTPPPGQPNPHNVYDVSFTPQSSNGPYTITIGPNISDFSGNLMDQDMDGPPNGQADDSFTGRFFANTTTNGPFVPGILGRETSGGGLWVGVSNGSSAFTNSFFGALTPGITWVDVVTGDFTGSGKTDVAARNLQTGQWYVGVNTGSTFAFSVWTSWSPAVNWVDVKVGDFTGDGRDDIVGRVQSTGQWWVATSSGSNTFNNGLWAIWSPNVTWVDVKVGHFAGNATADITGRWLQGGSWWTGVSNGTSFQTSMWDQWNPNVTWVDVNAGDFNGDGKTDIVGRWLQSGQWWVAQSTGTSFVNALWDTWNPNVTWADVRVGDFNGDGKTDIIGRWLQAGIWYVGASTSTSFNTTQWAAWNPNVTWVDPIVGDFNGDGKDDIAERWLQGGQWWTGISTSTSLNTTFWDSWSTAVNWTNVQLMKNV
jgi:hypothetical protein